MSYKGQNSRLRYVFIFFSFLFVIMAARLLYIQVIRQTLYKKLAQGQHIKVIPLKGARGNIFDRKGRLLATDINVYSVYADPHYIKDVNQYVAQISNILDVDAEELRAKLNKQKRFVWVARKISLKQKDALSALDLAGIDFIKETKRLYPQGSLLSHVLGGVNIDNKGIEGVEAYYDSFLKGKDGLVSIHRDSTSTNLYFSPEILTPQKGMDLYLTIDAQVQYWVETFLADTVDSFRARGGSVIVIEPSTGEIIALGNYPAYDPNHISKATSDELRNVAVADMFEPGSVFKIVSLIGALDQKLFSLEEVIFCEEGKLKVPGTTLHDWRPYGDLTFKDVFKRSSNIGVAKIATALGKERLYGYIRKAGFGQKTGIDLYGESPGSLKPPKAWSRTSPYIIPIGQEIGVTLLQLGRLVSAVTNGGYLIRPHLVSEIQGAYGYQEHIRLRKTKAFSSWLMHLTKSILNEVVTEGTAKRARIDEISVGGKTGTAQKFDVSLGRYSAHAYRASFAGFVEKDSKTYVICVSIDEPRKSHFGGVVAAPLFKRIGEKLIAYMQTEKTIAGIR